MGGVDIFKYEITVSLFVCEFCSYWNADASKNMKILTNLTNVNEFKQLLANVN